MCCTNGTLNWNSDVNHGIKAIPVPSRMLMNDVKQESNQPKINSPSLDMVDLQPLSHALLQDIANYGA